MMTDFQEKGFSLGQTVKNTLACEATIKNMAMVFTHIRTDLSMRETFLKISHME
jgi:hypothetical protein